MPAASAGFCRSLIDGGGNTQTTEVKPEGPAGLVAALSANALHDDGRGQHRYGYTQDEHPAVPAGFDGFTSACRLVRVQRRQFQDFPGPCLILLVYRDVVRQVIRRAPQPRSALKGAGEAWDTLLLQDLLGQFCHGLVVEPR